MHLRTLCLLAVALFVAPVALAQHATDEAQAHLQRNAFRYGLSATDLSDLVVTDTYTSRRSGTTHVYLRQQANGIEIAGAEFTVAIDRNGHVFHAVGKGASELERRPLATSPAVTAEGAAEAVARDTGLAPTSFQVLSADNGRAPRVTLSEAGVAEEPVTARLVYRLGADENLNLAWEVGLYEQGAQHFWHAYVDAESGRILDRRDLVVHDQFGTTEGHVETTTSFAPYAQETSAMAPLALAGSYRVFPIPVESPNHGGRSLVTNPDDAMASPFGWHDTDGAAGAEFTRTRGNNVHAYTDTNNSNSPDAGSDPDGGASLVFDFPLDLTQQPSANRPAAVANLFYWNNVFHDVMWHYGFDEPSGNFQVNNYGRGGIGGDDVRAEAQDGGGTCNANFFTPADGSRPRMQMYISAGGFFGCNDDPIQRDGSLDNGVIIHEYGHGVSNRLVGGPSATSCLSNSEQMGEGWSDLFGLLMTIEPGDAGTDARGIGTWLFGEDADGPGIRPTPYSTDFATDPATYATTRTSIVPHGVGYVWSTIAWEATWELIDNYGFDPDLYNYTGTSADAGNVVMFALLTEGMKLMPCSPGFVDARDGILAADQALYGGLHIDDLWAAFARRGLGIGASQGSTSSNSDNVEDFAEPEQIPPTPITDLAAAPASLGITLTWTATGDDGTMGTASSYDIRYSTSGPITTDAAFETAMQVEGEPEPQVAGSAENFTVTGLAFSTPYWFAMKVSDNSFNTSALSNSAAATTLDAPSAQISTAPITVTTPPNTQTTATFSVGNNGQSALTYALDFAETTPARRAIRNEKARTAAMRNTAPELAEVKEADEPRGTSPQRGSGGPDAFGYNWIDSDEPGGPTYDWVDISTTGTSISLSDDDFEEVPLPFSFDFYGVAKTSVKISSNGYLTFGSDGSDYTNDAIPNSNDPDDFIAPFWDDLDPGNSGTSARIYYQDMGDGRFVVSWEDIPHYPNDGSFTFQAILYASGQMLFQYDEFMPDTGDEASATIGLEDGSASDGLEVVYNAPYVHPGLAVRISAIWVSADPGSGLVDSGSSDPVELTFDASGLAEGTYTADMTISTNDPSNPTVVVPLVFNVGEASQVTLNLTPAAPPVVVAPGGSVDYTATLFVPVGSPSSLDYWAEATLPSSTVRLAFGPGTVNVSPGTYVRSLTQQVPNIAPPGAYVYTMKVGSYPGTVIAQDSFDATVTATARGEGDAWLLFENGQLLEAGSTLDLRTPEAEETEAAAVTSLPTEPALYAAYPNPVGSTATVRYDVAETGTVRIVVYDLLGREIAVLVDDARETGQHTVMLDTRSLPSGTYILRMTAGSHVQAQRVTVVR